jgi:cytochrome c-type biogenesis protein CcmF
MANLFSPISRESSLVLNNVFLASITGGVFLGTFISLIAQEAFGTDVSAGAPVFNFFFVPLMLALMAFMAVGPVLAWKRGNIKSALYRLRAAGIAAAGMGASALIMQQEPWSMLALVISAWLLVGSFTTILEKALATGASSSLLARLQALPRAVYGTAFAHAGMAITTIGIAISAGNSEETVMKMSAGQSLFLSGYELRLNSVRDEQGSNYVSKAARFDVLEGGVKTGEVLSEKRTYPNPGSETTEAGIIPEPFGNLYVSLGRAYEDGTWAVRAYYHPFIGWIWAGACVMVFGGALSLSDRRLRVGAPIRARRSSAAVASAT